MALFSRNKVKEADKKEEAKKADKEEVAVVEKKQPTSTAQPTDRNLASVLIKPRITEKAVSKSEQNVYTFIVRRDASKYDVRDAIKQLYKVTPVKVNIVNKTPRDYMSRTKGRRLSEKGMKKAYVYLKQGDRIDLV